MCLTPALVQATDPSCQIWSMNVHFEPNAVDLPPVRCSACVLFNTDAWMVFMKRPCCKRLLPRHQPHLPRLLF